jgi:hypothetical protein
LLRNQNPIEELYSTGRHWHQIELITAHADKAICKEVRMNAASIIIVSRNSPEMFKNIKGLYGVRDPIGHFDLKYGYIEYMPADRSLKYFDADGNDEKVEVTKPGEDPSQESIRKERMEKLIRFHDVHCLTLDDEENVAKLLEDEWTEVAGHPVDIPRRLTRLYFKT